MPANLEQHSAKPGTKVSDPRNMGRSAALAPESDAPIPEATNKPISNRRMRSPRFRFSCAPLIMND
jgi:hypothetical protein